MVKIINKEKKEQQETKIIQAARTMFEKHGYDEASVNSIIKKLKIAKGTFYHYFPSKEDLLDKVMKVMTREALRPIKKEIARTDIDALAKFNNVIGYVYHYKLRHRKIQKAFLQFFYNEKNLLLRHKIMQNMKAFIVPEFAKVVEQGKQEGIFTTQDSQIATEIMMDIMMDFLESILPFLQKKKLESADVDLILKRADIYRDSVKKIIGLEKGEINILDKEVIKKLLFVE